MKLRVYRTARSDISSAQDWYNEVQPSLGEAFNDELEVALKWLMRQPLMGSKRYAHLVEDGNLRFWSLDRFPFLVFYRFVQDEQGDILEVLRVIHEKRDITSAWAAH